jgi:tetratricopeptide (TPR) repeat protein
VLHAAGTLAYIQGDYSAAWALLEEGLATRRQLGDRKGIAHTLNNLGILTRQQGDFASARALHDESLAIRRELGDRLGVCPLAEQPGPRGQAIELALEKTVRHP